MKDNALSIFYLLYTVRTHSMSNQFSAFVTLSLTNSISEIVVHFTYQNYVFVSDNLDCIEYEVQVSSLCLHNFTVI